MCLRAEWKSVSIEPGAQYVTMDSITKMPLSFVTNYTCLLQVISKKVTSVERTTIQLCFYYRS